MDVRFCCRMPQKDVDDVWFDEFEAARRWADEHFMIGCTVTDEQGALLYTPLREGISDLLYHAKQFCDYARDNQFNYGDAPINPAINDDARLVSCDRLVGCCLYRWGWVDQPRRQGLRVACMRMADWCAEHGFTRVERVEDLEPGDICFQRWDANHQPAHTYLYAGKAAEEGMHYRYDGGSVELLRSTQPSCEPIHMFLFAYRPVAPADPVAPHFSFLYNGVPFDSLGAQAQKTENGAVYTLPDGVQLECRMARYPRQRVMDWQLFWHNPTDHESDEISNFWTCDVMLPMKSAPAVVYDLPCGDDPLPVPKSLQAGESLRMDWDNERQSENRLPCIELCQQTDGWLLGADGAEKWTALFERVDDTVHLRLGTEGQAFRLCPGETVRSLCVSLASYCCGRVQGHNRWRAYRKEINAPVFHAKADGARKADPQWYQNLAQYVAEWDSGLAVDVDPAPGDTYAWRSAYAPHLTLRGAPVTQPEGDEWIKRCIWEYLSVRDLLGQDFYPLISPSREDTGWSVSQFHDYENHRGLILAFRRENSPFPVAHVFPRDLEMYAHYEVVDMDTGKRMLISGKDVEENGMDLTISEQRKSMLLTYRALLPGMPY